MKKFFLIPTVIAIASFYLIYLMGYILFNYFSLNSHVVADIKKWEIQKYKNDKYQVQASYEFLTESIPYNKIYQFKKKYLNYYAALDDVKKMANKPHWTVWYSKEFNKFSLEKSFPFYSLIRIILALFVLVYFLIFKRIFFKSFQ